MGTWLNPGNENFRQMVENAAFYIDKTGMLAQFNQWLFSPQRYVCVSRARRFGKTIAADMVAEPHLSRPNLCDSESTCVSNGIMSVRRSIKSAHNPKSTGELLRTIHRRNMQTRLQADCASCGTIPHTSFAAK